MIPPGYFQLPDFILNRLKYFPTELLSGSFQGPLEGDAGRGWDPVNFRVSIVRHGVVRI